MIQRDYRPMLVILAVWALVAAWHPYSLGFYSDDWALFIPRVNQQLINELALQYPNYPYSLLEAGIHPVVATPRPGYAFVLFILKSISADSPFLWQITSSLLLLASAYAVYLLVVTLLSQLQFRENERQLGAMIAAAVYLLGPWSTVMGAWSTVAITLVSQISVMLGLAWIVSRHKKRNLGSTTGAAILLLIGFLIYEAYWLLFAPLLVILLSTDTWTFRDCLKFFGLVIGLLLVAVLIKSGLSKSWGILGKSISPEMFRIFLQNIQSYPRVLGDALQPVPFKSLCIVIFAIVVSSLALDRLNFRRLGTLLVSLLVGLTSSALLYSIVGYGLAGTGVMSRTLAAQNVCFSIFVGILMMPGVEKVLALNGVGSRGVAGEPLNRKIALSLLGSAFLILVFMLGGATTQRSNEWSALWRSEVSALKQFPYQKLLNDLRRFEDSKKITVVVQIDEDTRGEIFGAPWEIEQALIWMYPDLRSYAESHMLAILVGREAEWSTIWDGKKIVQKWCGSEMAVVNSVEAAKVLYVKLGTDGTSQYSDYVHGLEIGCGQVAWKLN